MDLDLDQDGGDLDLDLIRRDSVPSPSQAGLVPSLSPARQGPPRPSLTSCTLSSSATSSSEALQLSLATAGPLGSTSCSRLAAGPRVSKAGQRDSGRHSPARPHAAASTAEVCGRPLGHNVTLDLDLVQSFAPPTCGPPLGHNAALDLDLDPGQPDAPPPSSSPRASATTTTPAVSASASGSPQQAGPPQEVQMQAESETPGPGFISESGSTSGSGSSSSLKEVQMQAGSETPGPGSTSGSGTSSSPREIQVQAGSEAPGPGSTTGSGSTSGPGPSSSLSALLSGKAVVLDTQQLAVDLVPRLSLILSQAGAEVRLGAGHLDLGATHAVCVAQEAAKWVPRCVSVLTADWVLRWVGRGVGGRSGPRAGLV